MAAWKKHKLEKQAFLHMIWYKFRNSVMSSEILTHVAVLKGAQVSGYTQQSMVFRRDKTHRQR